MNMTQYYIQTWQEARTRFTNLLKDIKEEDLAKKLVNTKNTAGFLIAHICDVELLFAKNVFGASDIKVQARTVIAKHDTGEWTNLEELQKYQQKASGELKLVLAKQTETDWHQPVTTKEFGTKTKAEAIGRLISHTAYHAGQIALILKYSAKPEYSVTDNSTLSVGHRVTKS